MIGVTALVPSSDFVRFGRCEWMEKWFVMSGYSQDQASNLDADKKL